MLTLRTFAIGALVAALACGGDGNGEAGEADAGAVDSAALQREGVRAIEPGMTQEEVRATLGEPRTRVTMDGGFERWTFYSYDPQGQIAAKTLIIFGNDGKVAEVNDQ